MMVAIPMGNSNILFENKVDHNDEQAMPQDVEMMMNDEMNCIPSNGIVEPDSIRRIRRIPNSFDLRIERFNTAMDSHIDTQEPLQRLQQFHHRKF